MSLSGIALAAGPTSANDLRGRHARRGRRFGGGAPRRILIVEDDADLRDALVRRGYEVHTVGDGRAALERMQDLEPGIVVLDLMMPVMDGWGRLVVSACDSLAAAAVDADLYVRKSSAPCSSPPRATASSCGSSVDPGRHQPDQRDAQPRVLRDRPALFNTRVAGEYRFREDGLSGAEESRIAMWNVHKLEILAKHRREKLVREDCIESVGRSFYRRFMSAVLWAFEHDRIDLVHRLCASTRSSIAEATAITLAIATVRPGLRESMALVLLQGLWELEIEA